MKSSIIAFIALWLLSGCSTTGHDSKRWKAKHAKKRQAASWAQSKSQRPPPRQTRVAYPTPAAGTPTASFLDRDDSTSQPRREATGVQWPTRVHPKDGATMVYVHPGDYLVGRLDKPDGVLRADGSGARFESLPGFYIDRLEVTVRKFQQFKPAYDERPYADGERCPECPAMGIDWNDAARYCQWAGKRLPSEAEWIAAARGSSGEAWPWGKQYLPERANLLGRDDGAVFAAHVGSYPKGASPAGALDMIGNVWEWVGTAYRLASDKSGEGRILRMVKGGGWASRENAARISFRNLVNPNMKNPTFGFRCAWTPSPNANPKTRRTLTRK